MSQYKVINRFKDRDGRIYEAGDVYPAKGKELNIERADFLTKKHPKYGVSFLEKMEKPLEKHKVEERKEDETPKKPAKKKLSSTKKKSDE